MIRKYETGLLQLATALFRIVLNCDPLLCCFLHSRLNGHLTSVFCLLYPDLLRDILH